MSHKSEAKITDTSVTSDLDIGESRDVKLHSSGLRWWINKIRLPDVQKDGGKWSNAGTTRRFRVASEES